MRLQRKKNNGTPGLGKYFRRVKVNDIEMSGMTDPGSSVCIIKDSIVKKQEWPIKLKDIQLHGFGNIGSVSCFVVLEVKGDVDVFVNKRDICVVLDKALNVYIIIGRTFTEHESIVYYRVDERLNFVWRSDFPDLPFKDVDIDDESHIIVKSDGHNVIKPENVMLINAQIEQDNVPVANKRKEEVVVKDGQTVGTFRQHVGEIETDYVEITADMINVDHHTPGDIIDRLVILFNEYRDCFRFDMSELGCTNLIKMTTKITTPQ